MDQVVQFAGDTVTLKLAELTDRVVKVRMCGCVCVYAEVREGGGGALTHSLSHCTNERYELTHSLTHSHTLIHSHTHTHSFTHTHTHIFSLTRTHSFMLSAENTHARSRAPAHRDGLLHH